VFDSPARGYDDRMADPRRKKYTRELLEPIVRDSVSFRQVARKLGFSGHGRPNCYIKAKVQELGIDTSHFLGLRAHAGHRNKYVRRLRPEEVLVYGRRAGAREDTSNLRKAMLAAGVPEVCAECGQMPVWNGKPLRLQIDHRNGDGLDNRPGNPRFLCPNCHTQTPTYGSRNATYERSARIRQCGPRERPRKPRATKTVWPTDETLAEMVGRMPLTRIARHLGVSDTIVKRRCKKLGLPTRSRGQWTKKGPRPGGSQATVYETV
jgi:hypothetical protein